MIKMLRIDERLIHGQVAMVWSKALCINSILVANDYTATNEFQKMSMKLAVPSNIKFDLYSIDKSIKFLNHFKQQSLAIMIVVKNFKDALTIAQNVEQIGVINVGNYGLLSLNKHDKKKMQLDTCVKVDNSDLKYIRKLAALPFKFVSQLTPNSSKKDLKKLNIIYK
ncbi:PTS sugar transporter subunit IIB [Lactobacillus panisapium]|uniref:PTS system mannose/fructose/N-acetylgalactosamine-transporter subunit IIB n=1 Tax=Lactobacillus TaxID=1578 RepID=UPI000CDBA370|nr:MULTISPECIES: PTS sugar transporter subunit IIB [Lactobacillus]MCX8725868.1 PTS sugar transporter subunit IIB [Lactobacillus sp. B4007]QYN54030.1 PTS sugar transporter subunit IIB [Lactobacillus panisapium]